MSIVPAPAGLRDEVGFIILFRDVAETIDVETDPQLRRLTAAQDALAEEEASALPLQPPRGRPGPRRRGGSWLALHYAAPGDLARAAIQALASGRRPTGSSCAWRRRTTSRRSFSTGSRSRRRSRSCSRASSSTAPTPPTCACV